MKISTLLFMAFAFTGLQFALAKMQPDGPLGPIIIPKNPKCLDARDCPPIPEGNWEVFVQCETADRASVFIAARFRQDSSLGYLRISSDSLGFETSETQIVYTNAGGRAIIRSKEWPQIIVTTGRSQIEWRGLSWYCSGAF